MSQVCSCPAAAALTAIPTGNCSESFGQIQKVAFQRLYSAAGVKNKFDSVALIGKLASWTALTAALDGTKIVVSPYIEAPTNEAGAAITFGGGNETLGGQQRIIGREPSTFSAVIREQGQDVAKALKMLQCEAAAGNLGVFLFNENGQIEAIQDTTTSTTYYPIPVRTLFVSDKTHGGLDTPDSNIISWTFAPNYSDGLKIVTPEFNPLTDL